MRKSSNIRMIQLMSLRIHNVQIYFRKCSVEADASQLTNRFDSNQINDVIGLNRIESNQIKS